MSNSQPGPQRPVFLCIPLILASIGLLITPSKGYLGPSPFLPPPPPPPPSPSLSCSCVEDSQMLDMSQVVQDCCCSYGTVNALNKDVLFPILQDLVRTPFFRYFKVRLWCDCPFWPDDGMCMLRDCSVCECPDDEFPEVFKDEAIQAIHPLLPSDSLQCQEGKPQAAVDRTLDRTLDHRVFRGWVHKDNKWTSDNETNDQHDITYVNLLLNPERYTGYTGMSARRIWNAIYDDNASENQASKDGAEGRILYKLISGLHSSISIHIAQDYLLDEATSVWGPNPGLLYERVLKHPERVRNLYFCYLFVLRAVTKAGDFLLQADYSTGNDLEDDSTLVLMTQLVNNERLREACPKPFDEAELWRGIDGEHLLLQVQGNFRNISMLMDCVGCEKCRLWGKLQVLGLATALEILFADDPASNNHPLLQRNDVIALINLLNRLSESLHFLQKLTSASEELPLLQSISRGHAADI